MATFKLCRRSGGYDCKTQQLKFHTEWLITGTPAEVDPGNLRSQMGVNLPACQSLYVAEGPVVHTAFLVNASFANPTRKGQEWQAVASFDYETPVLPDGETQADPFARCPEIEASDINQRLAVNMLPFGGYFEQEAITCDTKPVVTTAAVDNQSVDMPNDFTLQPVQNTIGEQLDPPPEIDTSYIEYQFTFNRSVWEPEHITRQYAKFINRINSSQVVIDIPCRKFKLTAAKHTLWLTSIHPEFTSESINNLGTPETLNYVRQTYVVRYKPDGWYLDAGNRSRNRRVVRSKGSTAAKIPDGFGGFFPYEQLSDVPEGQPEFVAIKDFNGHPIEDPLWIDANGDPLRDDQRRSFMRYLEACEADLSDTKLGLVNWQTAP